MNCSVEHLDKMGGAPGAPVQVASVALAVTFVVAFITLCFAYNANRVARANAEPFLAVNLEMLRESDDHPSANGKSARGYKLKLSNFGNGPAVLYGSERRDRKAPQTEDDNHKRDNDDGLLSKKEVEGKKSSLNIRSGTGFPGSMLGAKEENILLEVTVKELNKSCIDALNQVSAILNARFFIIRYGAAVDSLSDRGWNKLTEAIEDFHNPPSSYFGWKLPSKLRKYVRELKRSSPSHADTRSKESSAIFTPAEVRGKGKLCLAKAFEIPDIKLEREIEAQRDTAEVNLKMREPQEAKTSAEG